MKKYLIAILFGLFTISQASAELGVNVGISGSAGLFAASGKEVAGKTTKGTEHGAAGWTSVFIEKSFGDRFAIGIDYLPSALETDTVETAKQDKDGSATPTDRTNQIQIDFEDLTTLYIAVNVTENAYLKLGVMKVDVITNEKLGTGATYGNTDLDGTSIGFGTNKDFDNGLFVRAEANYMTFDSTSGLVSGDNTVTLTNLDGVTASLKIGKSF
jgi:hypothetical protein|tara:strand:- start:453 stop:1094 length:642 start_codon:yes stop_codon:yes gene_type:complete